MGSKVNHMATSYYADIQKMVDVLPKPEPGVFVVGVAGQLREMAELIENGTLTVAHFSLTTHVDPVYKQRLEIEVS